MKIRYTVEEVINALDVAVKNYPDVGISFLTAPAGLQDLIHKREVEGVDSSGKRKPYVAYVAFITKNGGGLPVGFSSYFATALYTPEHTRLMFLSHFSGTPDLPIYKLELQADLDASPVSSTSNVNELAAEWNYNLKPSMEEISDIINDVATAFGLNQKYNSVMSGGGQNIKCVTLLYPNGADVKFAEVTERLGLSHPAMMAAPLKRLEGARDTLIAYFKPYVDSSSVNLTAEILDEEEGETADPRFTLSLRVITLHDDMLQDFLRSSFATLSKSIDPEKRVVRVD